MITVRVVEVPFRDQGIQPKDGMVYLRRKIKFSHALKHRFWCILRVYLKIFDEHLTFL